jgi:hypothetical protein
MLLILFIKIFGVVEYATKYNTAIAWELHYGLGSGNVEFIVVVGNRVCRG